jgi:dihydroorotate dehydrogenase electron transfer subunit
MAKEMEREEILMLTELGARSKFKVWRGKKNQYAQEKLSGGTLNYLPLPENLEKIRGGIEQLDILWLKRNKILYHFQIVEKNRLSLTLKRYSDELINSSPATRRILVIPRGPDRAGSFADLTEDIENGRYGYWDYLYFDDLKEYYKNPDYLLEFTPVEKIYEEKARVVEVKFDFSEKYSPKEPRHCELKLESPFIGRKIRPGQFIQVLCTDEKYLHQFDYRRVDSPVLLSPDKQKWEEAQILRRPFSLYRVYQRNFQPKFLKETDRLPIGFLRLLHPGARVGVNILFKLTGKGTNLLAKKEIGDEVNLLGPLGTGIREIDHKFKVVYLVAGGIGIAPLFAIAEYLRRMGKETRVLLGVRDKQSIPLGKVRFHKRSPDLSVEPITLIDEFKEIGCRVTLGYEEQGKTAVDLLKEELDEERVRGRLKREELKVYSCGPPAMLKKVARIAKSELIDCEVLLEGRMACGVGACLSCAVESYERGKSGRYLNRRVHRKICTDGPLFDAREINWRQFALS